MQTTTRSPKLSLRDAIRRGPLPQGDDAPLTADEIERIERWRSASLEEHARALADLLRMVDAVGHRQPKESMFPGWRKIARSLGAR